MEIKHFRQISGSRAMEIAIEGEAFLHAQGFSSPHLHVQWNHEALVADVDGEAAGILVYADVDWKNEVWVVLGYVRPHFRRRGIYRALWEALVVRARQAGRPRIGGDTSIKNKAMQQTMEALGRRPVAIIYDFDVPEEE